MSTFKEIVVYLLQEHQLAVSEACGHVTETQPPSVSDAQDTLLVRPTTGQKSKNLSTGWASVLANVLS
jgi:hypothetical protein